MSENKEPIHLQPGLMILNQDGAYVLPMRPEGAHRIVELFLLKTGCYRFDGRGFPIKYDNKIGNTICLDTSLNKTYRNPKFYFNKEDETWHLITVGYAVFLEQEVGGEYSEFKD
jgi:hypothetical protein